MKLRSNQSLTK